MMSDKLLLKSAWDVHMDRVCKKASYAYAQCNHFVSGYSLYIENKIHNFNTMIRQQYTYNMDVIFPTQAKLTQTFTHYGKLVKKVCNIGIRGNSLVCIMLSYLKPLQW